MVKLILEITMKYKSKVPFKSKKSYNVNEVDVNLLLKNPSHIRKIVKGNHKEEGYHDEDEEEEDEDDDKLERHMKRYIDDYLARKHLKEAEQRGKVKKRLDVIKGFHDSVFPNEEYKEKMRSSRKKKGIIQEKVKEWVK